MSSIDFYLNPGAFADVDATVCECVLQSTDGFEHANHPASPTTTTVTQGDGPISPWTASFPEIAGRIFIEMREALRSDHPAYQSAWLRLTWVCRAWRQLVLGTPALWTHIRMYNITHPWELERLLSRSGDLPVDLELNFGDSQSRLLSAADFERAVGLAVQRHGHRIAAFDVFCSTRNLMPIYRVDSILHFPDGVEVSLSPQTSPSEFPWSVMRLHGGSFPRLSGLLRDDAANPNARKVFRAIGKAGRHNLEGCNYWRAFGFRIPQVVYAFWSLTHLYLEYCGPQDREGSVMEKIILLPTFRSLAITDKPRKMQTLLSHITFAFGAEDCERIRIKLTIDLQDPKYSSRYALQDLLLAIQWPSLKFHVSVCSAVHLHITSDYSLTLAGFDAEHRPKFQFDFFNASDRNAILGLAADMLNDYYRTFDPCEPRDVPWFSEMQQLSIHDASGKLGRLLNWDALVSSLPQNIRSLSLGNARVVDDFLLAMDRLACQAASDGAALRCKTQTVRLSRLAWCVNSCSLDDVTVLQRCRAVGILDVGEVVFRAARQVDPGTDEFRTLNGLSTPRLSPPPSDAHYPLEGENRNWRACVEDGVRCSICRHEPRSVLQSSSRCCFQSSFSGSRPPKKLVQKTDVRRDEDGHPSACVLDNLKTMNEWDDSTGVWEDHIWNMTAIYNDADWTYMSA